MKCLVRPRMDMRDRIAAAATARIKKHSKLCGGQSFPWVAEDEGFLVERIDEPGSRGDQQSVFSRHGLVSLVPVSAGLNLP